MMFALRTSAFVLSALVFSSTVAQPCLAQQKSAAQSKAAAPQKAAPTAEKGKKSGAASSDAGTVMPLNAAGWPIVTTYFESQSGKESPVVILLTSTEGSDKVDARNRLIWQSTALALQKSGFAVITADLRKHGESIPPVAEGKESSMLKMNSDDYPLMVTADMEAIKAFLLSEHTAEKLNVRKLGIVSMGSSSMVAAAFAVADWDKKPYPDGPTLATSTPRGQDVRALICYSPATTVKGINSTAILKAIKPLPIAVYIIAAKDNKDDMKNAEKFFKAVDPKDEAYAEFRKLVIAPGNIRAERFLEAKVDEANKDITDFMTKNLKQLEMPWVSRKDRREN
jgi:pimeloyl-ACP methyl ester carboxylesterase